MKMFLVAAVMMLAGCASFVNGRQETIAVDSEPPGAAVSVNCDGVAGSAKTPGSVIVVRKAMECSLTFALDGYVDQTVTLKRHTSPAWGWDLLPGLAVGILVAGATGVATWGCSDCEGQVNGSGLAGIAVGTGLALWIDQKTGGLYRHASEEVRVKLQPKP